MHLFLAAAELLTLLDAKVVRKERGNFLKRQARSLDHGDLSAFDTSAVCKMQTYLWVAEDHEEKAEETDTGVESKGTSRSDGLSTSSSDQSLLSWVELRPYIHQTQAVQRR